MLKSKDLPMFLWGEKVLTTTFVLNRSSTKHLEGITPEEAWTERKLDVTHLWIFGSMSYQHVPDQLRQKLNEKGTPLVLGYHLIVSYKLHIPENGKVLISGVGSQVVKEAIREINHSEASC